MASGGRKALAPRRQGPQVPPPGLLHAHQKRPRSSGGPGRAGRSRAGLGGPGGLLGGEHSSWGRRRASGRGQPQGEGDEEPGDPTGLGRGRGDGQDGEGAGGGAVPGQGEAVPAEDLPVEGAAGSTWGVTTCFGGPKQPPPAPQGSQHPAHHLGTPHSAPWVAGVGAQGARGDPKRRVGLGSRPRRRGGGSPGSEAARRYGPKRVQGRQPRPCMARDIPCGKSRARQRGEMGAGQGSPPRVPFPPLLLPPPGPAALTAWQNPKEGPKYWKKGENGGFLLPAPPPPLPHTGLFGAFP